MSADNVICPNCNARIPISKLLTDQIRAELQHSFDGRIRDEQIKMQARMDAKLRDERSRMEADALKRAEATVRGEVVSARKEAEASAKRVEKLMAQLETKDRSLESEIKKRLQAARKQIEDEVEDRIAEENRSRELAAQRQLSDARLQISDLKRKLDTSSRQLEGEVVEGDLHAILTKAYPSDEVRAMSKRGGGADVHQHVYSPGGRDVGSIVWESKNTAQWSNSWLAKLRQDQRRVKADFAVLVTPVRPKNCGKLEFRDGVWITEHSLAVGVAAVLRSNLIQLSQYKDLPPETAEKFAIIQRYLSSTEFRQRIEAIVEAFQTMRDDLASEKRATERHWAQREKQLQMVIENVSGMYGELRAVTGPTLARVRRLELPGS